MKIKQVSLHGAYIGSNYGDQLLLSIFIKWIKEFDPEIKINLPLYPKRQSRPHGIDSIGLDKFKNSNFLIYIGGGYFGEPNSQIEQWSQRNYKRFVEIGLQAIKHNIRIGLFGIGVGPLSDRRMRTGVKAIFEHADVAVVRDLESLSFVEQLCVNNGKFFLGADAAVTICNTFPRKNITRPHNTNTKRISIGIHLSSDKIDSELIFKLSSIAVALPEKLNAKLAYLHDYRRGFASRILHHMKIRGNIERKILHGLECVNPPYSDPWQFTNKLSNFDLIITEKLHVGIVATSLGIPVIAIPRHQKTIRYYRQIGREDLCLDYKALTIDELKSKIDQLVTTTEITIPSLVVEKAQLNQYKLIQLLSNEKK